LNATAVDGGKSAAASTLLVAWSGVDGLLLQAKDLIAAVMACLGLLRLPEGFYSSTGLRRKLRRFSDGAATTREGQSRAVGTPSTASDHRHRPVVEVSAVRVPRHQLPIIEPAGRFPEHRVEPQTRPEPSWGQCHPLS
jgi:hypothetical protein